MASLLLRRKKHSSDIILDNPVSSVAPEEQKHESSKDGGGKSSPSILDKWSGREGNSAKDTVLAQDPGAADDSSGECSGHDESKEAGGDNIGSEVPEIVFPRPGKANLSPASSVASRSSGETQGNGSSVNTNYITVGDSALETTNLGSNSGSSRFTFFGGRTRSSKSPMRKKSEKPGSGMSSTQSIVARFSFSKLRKSFDGTSTQDTPRSSSEKVSTIGEDTSDDDGTEGYNVKQEDVGEDADEDYQDAVPFPQKEALTHKDTAPIKSRSNSCSGSDSHSSSSKQSEKPASVSDDATVPVPNPGPATPAEQAVPVPSKTGHFARLTKKAVSRFFASDNDEAYDAANAMQGNRPRSGSSGRSRKNSVNEQHNNNVGESTRVGSNSTFGSSLSPSRPYPMFRSISSQSQEKKDKKAAVAASSAHFDNGLDSGSQSLNRRRSKTLGALSSSGHSGSGGPLLYGLLGSSKSYVNVPSSNPRSIHEDKFRPSMWPELPVPLENETPQAYLDRIRLIYPDSVMAAVLASRDKEFYRHVLQCYTDVYDFGGDPLDMALRKFLVTVKLPTETQQIDRVLESLALTYHKCNPNIYVSGEVAYIVVFSLMILHTDFFNKNNKYKMQKSDYIRNTNAKGVQMEILECFYDNITYTPFIHSKEEISLFDNNNGYSAPHAESENGGMTTPELASSSSFNSPMLPAGPLSTPPLQSAGTFSSVHQLQLRPTAWSIKNSSFRSSKDLIDPYSLMIEGKLDIIRPNLSEVVPSKDPYTFKEISSTDHYTNLKAEFLNGPSLQLVSQNSRPGAYMHNTELPDNVRAQPGVVDIKVVKVGTLFRREARRMLYSRSTWKEWGAVLTASQLYLFKDVSWVRSTILNQTSSVRNDLDASTDIEDGGADVSYNSNDDSTGCADSLVEQPISSPLFGATGTVPSSPMVGLSGLSSPVGRLLIDGFHPSAVISTYDMVALRSDNGETNQKNTFLLVSRGGAQDWFAAPDEEDMSDWMNKINLAAAFNTFHVGMDASNQLSQEPYHSIHSSTVSMGKKQPSRADNNIEREIWCEAHSIRLKAIDHKLAEITAKLEVYDSQLDEKIRTGNHLKILAPIQQKTREAVLLAAGRLAAKIDWNWIDRKRLVCYRHLFELEREAELEQCERLDSLCQVSSADHHSVHSHDVHIMPAKSASSDTFSSAAAVRDSVNHVDSISMVSSRASISSEKEWSVASLCRDEAKGGLDIPKRDVRSLRDSTKFSRASAKQAAKAGESEEDTDMKRSVSLVRKEQGDFTLHGRTFSVVEVNPEFAAPSNHQRTLSLTLSTDQNSDDIVSNDSYNDKETEA